MGSDCIGRPCFSCEFGVAYESDDSLFKHDDLLKLIETTPWTCPDHPEAELIIQMIASDPGGVTEHRTCSICYKNSFLVY